MRFSWIHSRHLVLAAAVSAFAGAVASPAAGQVQDTTTVEAIAPEPVVPESVAPQAAPADTTRPDTTATLLLGHVRAAPPLPRLVGPRLSNARLEPHWTDLSGRWWRQLERQLDEGRASMWRDSHGLLHRAGERRTRLAVAADTVRYLPVEEAPLDTVPTLESFLPGRVGQYADLGMLVTGRGDMGGAWQRFEPCDASGFNSCEQGLTPRLQPDLQFGVLLGGTITDRVHVSVDYDQTREFDAANNINVYYQGLEDEMLQRFEVGDVSITMPQSRFLTGGVPGGNFGFRALAQVGPLELQSVWAQQQGDISSLDINIDARTGGQYSDNRITLDDHAYASGRFFFLVDPEALPGYPHVDVLALRPGDAGGARPRGESLQLYRDENLSQTQREASRVFRGRAEAPDGSSELGGHFRLLGPEDYVRHSSGLWIMLRQPLGSNEILAMSYQTEAGDTVGTLDAGSVAGEGDGPLLRLLRGPTTQHHPDAATWVYEMHQIYPVFSGDLDPSELSLQITLGDAGQGNPFVTYDGEQIPLLRLFGVDLVSPEQRVDLERVFRPGQLSQSSAITGTYLVFPTLRPFADPPGTPGLTADEADAALGADANHRIYEERDAQLRSVARFRLTLDYRVRTDGLVSEFPLGSFGVREGSERIQVDGVTLTRGTDYDVDYATGTVRLLNPQQLFAGRQSPRITATFEQSSLFEIAPKSLFGTTARWRLGQAGEVNLVGLYQNQRSVMTRPQLGNEPNSIMMGGLTTNLRFDANWMDRALDAIPGLRLGGESSIGLTGELAMSLPNPNTRGVAWLDDFEATAEIRVGLGQNSWRLGSRPGTTSGAGLWLPDVLDQTNVFDVVWQHQAYGRGGGTYGAFASSAVDTSIVTAGRAIPEPVLFVSMLEDEDLPRDERVWRSLTTVFSTRGTDMTSSEFLEFYALEVSDDIALVFDIGTVGEDSYFVDSLGAVHGIHPVTGDPWGEGVLDQEADYDQPWGRDLDHGLWDQDCQTEPGQLTLLGSRNANCTINNGLNDTEDLNGDGVATLNDGAYFRYSVPIGPNSPYLVRDRAQTGTGFRMYRVPLRGPRALPINGAGVDTWRNVQHMRMTVTSGRCHGDHESSGGAEALCAETLLLSRMRISGSTWRKREMDGVLAGMTQADTVPGDQSMNMHVGPVSRVTETVYVGPPGTSNAAADPTETFGASGVEVQEKGLRIAVTDLEPDARGEVFHRFASETRSFMEYRQMRLWALPRAGDWGPDGTLSLLVKVGTDDGNYYLYRSTLRPPVENRDVNSAGYWLPELIIDFEPWLRLKAEAETQAVQAGVGEQVVWNEDSTYAIVLTSRAQAPNLAAIRELSIAVHNGSGLPADSVELWVNDLRLAGGRTDAGFAGVFSVDARAADFATFRLQLSNQGAMFHPMDRDPSLEGLNDLGVSGRFEMGHFAPSGWGLSAPVTVQHTRQDRVPEFLNRTDIRASDLDGLRPTGAAMTSVGLSVSKSTPSPNPWLGLLVDGATLTLNWRDAGSDAFTQSRQTSQLTGGVAYNHQLRPRTIGITPDLLDAALRALAPERIENSEFFGRITGAQLRWSPSDVSFSTSYLGRQSKTLNYPAVLAGPADDDIEPILSPERDLQNVATLGLRPFESLSARISVRSSRDLLSPDDWSSDEDARRAVADARDSFGGLELGWEKSRGLNGTVSYQPRVASWLRPTVNWTTDYGTARTPHYLGFDADSVPRMQRDFRVDGRLERRLYFDPAGLVRAAWGGSPAELGFVRGMLHRLGGALQPLDLTWNDQRSSSFERREFEPGYGYRFGLGGLDALRVVQGDTAVNAAEIATFQARGGLLLPGGLQLDATYVASDRYSISGQGGDNDQTDRTWPSLTLGMASIPLPAFATAVLSRASASTGYRVEESEQRFGNALASRSTASIPVQFSATFTNGMTASYSGTFGTTGGLLTTGETRGRDRLHNVQLRATFDSPESLGEAFDQPMTASLGFNYSSNGLCDVGSQEVDGVVEERCAYRVDRISRDVHFAIETLVNDLNLGIQFSLNDHQSFVGLRDGSSEFRLGIFANFNIGVGVLPAGLGQGPQLGY